MKTKDKILMVALRQFNERGTDRVTVRSISEEIGISPGNFHYHFKNTDAVIQQLYLDLAQEMAEELVRMQSSNMDLAWLLKFAEIPFRKLYKYKFLLLDFVRIMRRIESVRIHFRQHIAMQKVQFSMAIQHMIAQGILREEWIEGMYDRLIQRFLILGDAWIPHAEIHFDDADEQVIRYYSDLFMDALVPYLTEEGLERFHEIKSKNDYDSQES